MTEVSYLPQKQLFLVIQSDLKSETGSLAVSLQKWKRLRVYQLAGLLAGITRILITYLAFSSQSAQFHK